MRLGALIDGLDLRLPDESAAEVEVRDVTEDSRTVEPGSLFVARPGGSVDGRRFIDEAIRRGAAAVLAEVEESGSSNQWRGRLARAEFENTTTHRSETGATRSDAGGGPSASAPIIECRGADRLGAELAERVHGRPSRRLTLIGVTGSNGKTTTAHLIRELLNAGGVRCGLVGTVYVDEGRIGRRGSPSRAPVDSDARDGTGQKPAPPAPYQSPSLTTPTGPDLSRLLRRMVENGCEAAVIEVSSHALDQGRTDALDFDIGVFTNLSGEHMDYHGSMEAYAAAKARLFEPLAKNGLAVVNADDSTSERMIRDCPAAVMSCRLTEECGWTDAEGDEQNHASQCAVWPRSLEPTRMRLRLNGPWGSVESTPPLIGEHNAMNLLEATAAAHAAGIGAERIAGALGSITSPPGRLERIEPPEGALAPTVLVDYAHTDAALDNALRAVRPSVPPGGRLIVVFGAGGDRDRSKRPRMGAVAAEFGDALVVTSDNPRTEDPEAIIREILDGISDEARRRAIVEPDRARAIHAAVNRAESRDVVLIAGKGHEDYQIVSDGRGGTVRRDFDDRRVARGALRERTAAAGATTS